MSQMTGGIVDMASANLPVGGMGKQQLARDSRPAANTGKQVPEYQCTSAALSSG
jgi:hypothetical protein